MAKFDKSAGTRHRVSWDGQTCTACSKPIPRNAYMTVPHLEIFEQMNYTIPNYCSKCWREERV